MARKAELIKMVDRLGRMLGPDGQKARGTIAELEQELRDYIEQLEDRRGDITRAIEATWDLLLD